MPKLERQHIKIVHGAPNIIKESVISHGALRKKKERKKTCSAQMDGMNAEAAA